MQSQGSQDTSFSATGSLVLSLSKFSYATVSEDTIAPIPWIHLSSKGNLYARFDNVNSLNQFNQMQECKKFRVVNGSEVMEDLDLLALAAEAKKANQPQISNLVNRTNAVTIIVKRPCIAVRYPSAHGQIRRFQMRFALESDWYSAMGRLSEVNAPVTEAGTFPLPQPQPRPYSSSSSLLQPSDSISQVNAVSPSASSFLAPHRSSSGSVSNGVNAANPMLRPSISLSSVQRLAVGSGVELPSIHETAIFKPRNPQVAPAAACLTPAADSSQPSINLYEPRPSTAPVVESQNLTEMLPPKRTLPFAIFGGGSRSTTAKEVKSTVSLPLPNVKSSKNSEAIASCISKPQVVDTQMAELHEIETQSAPPTAPKSKRAPPKKRAKQAAKKPTGPSSRKKATTKQAGSPISSVETLLSRSQDSVNEVATLSERIDTQALLAQVEERLEVATPLATSNYTALPAIFSQEDDQISQEVQQVVQNETLLKSPAKSRVEEPALRSELVSAVTRATDLQAGDQAQVQNVPNSGESDSSSFICALQAPPHSPLTARDVNTVLPHDTSLPTRPTASVDSLPRSLRELLQDPDFAPSPNLALWAKHPEVDRHAILETFICQQLGDEHFLTLCKELGKSWQRAFLGKMI